LPVIRQWPLVGRSEELAVIAEATRATGERAHGIVLSGSAGVGKTRVAREAVASCSARSARRHWIIGTASARSVPLGAFVDIASDFGPDPLRRVREVIDGLIGDPQSREVVVGVDDALGCLSLGSATSGASMRSSPRQKVAMRSPTGRQR
jgi:AAA ATPase domain